MSLAEALVPERKNPPEEMAKPLSWGFLAGVFGVVLGTFAASIDERLASAAQTDIIGGLGYGPDEGSWIATSYDVGQVIVLAAAPWLGAVLSVRRLTVCLICVGALAAAAASNAHSYGELVMLRLFQGIGNGGMLPMMLSTMLTLLPKNRKAAGLAVYAFVVVFASVLSQSIEGVYTDLFVWRAVFWTSVVAAPFAAFLVLVFTPATPSKWGDLAGADYVGLATLAAFAGLFAIGLDQGQRLDWFASPFIRAVFVFAVLCLIGFVANEIASGSPLYRLSLFGKPTFSAGVGIITLTAMTLLAATFLFPQDQIMVRGLRPLQIGNTLLWLTAPAIVSALLTVLLLRILDGRLVMVAGLTLVTGGLWASVWITPVWDGADFQPMLQAETAGWVMAIAANAFVTTAVLEPEENVTGAVAFNVLRTFGFLAGASILNGILQVRTRVHSDDAIAAHLDIAREPVRERLASGGLAALDHSQHLQATVMAIADCFGALAIVGLVAILLSLLQSAAPVIRRRPQ
jgi:DHA2 family multidrug resistance protein